jgi:hypothetical protein
VLATGSLRRRCWIRAGGRDIARVVRTVRNHLIEKNIIRAVRELRAEVGGVKIRAFFGVSVEFIPRPTGGGCDRSPSCTRN